MSTLKLQIEFTPNEGMFVDEYEVIGVMKKAIEKHTLFISNFFGDKDTEYCKDAEMLGLVDGVDLVGAKECEYHKPALSEKKIISYNIACPTCGTLFEKTVEEVGLEPFDTSCPNCNSDVRSQHTMETIYD